MINIEALRRRETMVLRCSSVHGIKWEDKNNTSITHRKKRIAIETGAFTQSPLLLRSTIPDSGDGLNSDTVTGISNSILFPIKHIAGIGILSSIQLKFSFRTTIHNQISFSPNKSQ